MKAQLVALLDKYGDPDWRLAHKMWSVRIVLLSAAIDGVWLCWPAFQNIIDPYWFMGIGVTLSLAAVVARLADQSGFSK